MKGQPLDDPERFAMLDALRGMERHIAWILDASTREERGAYIVDSYDVRTLAENLAQVVRLSGLVGEEVTNRV